MVYDMLEVVKFIVKNKFGSQLTLIVFHFRCV
jgi:hypothetical protein